MTDESSDSGPSAPGDPRGDRQTEPRASPAPPNSLPGSLPDSLPDSLKDRLYVIVFEAESPAGRMFDIAVLLIIVASVLAVSLESVATYETRFGATLRGLEWAFTLLFSAEYALRLYVARRRLKYVFSFFGVVDLLSLLPTFLSLVFTSVHSLLVIRALRLLRVFRVLKVMRHLGEANHLMSALRASVPKISVFLGAVLIIAVIVGAMMYVIEDPEAGFTSVPRSVYWAIVTMTTVGYGDIAPRTVLGQTIAAMLMIVGYGIIAVPTGIVSAQIVGNKDAPPNDDSACHSCGTPDHHPDANFCRVCGSALD